MTTESWWVNLSRDEFARLLREAQERLRKQKDIYVTAKAIGSSMEQLHKQAKERRGQ